MKKAKTQKNPNKPLAYKKIRQEKNEDSGIALVTTMLLGMTLLLGTTGLIVRQLTARKLAASESYMQIAEVAANNGLNHILSELNNDKEGLYRGYLLGLANRENENEPNNGFSWELINTPKSPIFSEVCTDTSRGLPAHPEGDQSKWPTHEVPEQTSAPNSIREEGSEKGNLRSSYRLRSYLNPSKSNNLDNGQATFIVEGFAKRDKTPSGTFLARARLERSLYVQSAVLKKNPKDWSALFAKDLRLGETNIQGDGLIGWQIDESQKESIANSCGTANILSRISKSTSLKLIKRIWPVTNQPLTSDNTQQLFTNNGNIDKRAGTSGKKRIWRIDDKNSWPGGKDYRQSVCYDARGVIWAGRYFKICERLDDGSSPIVNNKTIKASYSYPYIESDIVLTQDEFCPNKLGDCHIYIEHLDLTKTNLYVENDKRPVILHLVKPKEVQVNTSGSQGLFNLADGSIICGVDQGKKQCNKQPERLIIMSDNNTISQNCTNATYPLEIGGNSIPHAFINLSQGTLKFTSNVELNGAIWAQNLCAEDNKLSISVPQNLFASAYDLWKWEDKNFQGFGRSTSRTIRGSGYDTFKRF